MGNNNTKGDTVELWGQKFKTVKKGLDEAEVVSFVSKLIDERNRLVQQEEHFSSLTKLAERTIVESDKLAEEIKREATEKAKAEADAIIAKAEEQAKQMIEEKQAEIIAVATEEAEAIRADAEREATLLIENQRQRIQPELRDMTQQVYNELLSQLESLKQQAIASKVEFEQKLPQLVEETSQEPVSAQVPTTIKQEGDMVPPSDSEESIETVDVSAEAQPPTEAIEQTDMNEVEEKTLVSVDSQEATLYNGEVELEILPPINIMQIIVIMQYLDNLPEVEATELIPLYDKPSIIASLREPLPLLDILNTLPGVEEAKEDTDGETADSADTAEGKRRRIKIRLSLEKSVLDETKERLNNEVSNILSETPDSGKE